MCMRLCKCNTNSSHDDVSDRNEDVISKCIENLGYDTGYEHQQEG